MILATLAQVTYSTDFTTYSTPTSSSSLSWAVLAPLILVYIAVIVFMIVSLWKVFVKTGRPGWASIIPVYNSWVLFEIVGYPGWWAILSFVPFVNIFPAVMMIVSYFKLAKLFGKGDGFAVCSIFFPIVTLPILAFGSSTFQGAPVASAASAPQAPLSPTAVQPQTVNAPEAPKSDEQTPQAPLVQ